MLFFLNNFVYFAFISGIKWDSRVNESPNKGPLPSTRLWADILPGQQARLDDFRTIIVSGLVDA